MAHWDKITSRGNVEDRRGAGPVMLGGIGTVGILVLVAMSFFGGNNSDIAQVIDMLEQSQMNGYQNSLDTTEFQGEDDYETFVSSVLGSNNDLWGYLFTQNQLSYKEPRLVLFREQTSSACGGADSRVGPHYCPLDQTIYLDETFFDELTQRFGARGGDVAEAYVISHEVGHHIQKLLGTTDRVEQYGNSASVALELQADCLAGMWMHSIADAGVFETGEALEAIDAAESVGDDRIQEATLGRSHPESWTHGSSEQRKMWLMKGIQYGDYSKCETR